MTKLKEFSPFGVGGATICSTSSVDIRGLFWRSWFVIRVGCLVASGLSQDVRSWSLAGIEMCCLFPPWLGCAGGGLGDGSPPTRGLWGAGAPQPRRNENQYVHMVCVCCSWPQAGYTCACVALPGRSRRLGSLLRHVVATASLGAPLSGLR